MPRTAVFKKNHILASLPEPEWKEWSPFLELVQMPLGLVLYEPGVKLTHIYFPITAIVSLLYVMENGASAEIAVVGNEGLESHCSWAGTRRRVGRLCKVRASAAGSNPTS
jgi:hypothetical protein